VLSIYSSVATLYRFRWLLYELVVRDLKLRYRGSVLGFAWTLLNPILFMAIYTLVFSVYMRVGIHDYPLYLLSGLIPWTFIQSAIQQAITAIPDGRMYVGKSLFPIELLVVVPVLSNAVNFMLSLFLVIGLALALGVHIGWMLLLLPVIIAIELVMVVGLAFLGATVNVFYRDIQQLVGYALTAIFFVTPIFYAASSVPPKFTFLLACSPIAALIASFQSILYYGLTPSWGGVLFAAVFSIFVLGASIGYFNRYRDAFAEYV
jgi:lipopolysaccharide transport system permease protein